MTGNQKPGESGRQATIVAQGVRRLTSPNRSPMTADGTQTYLVGEGAVAVIDPGPLSPEHHQAILRALAPGERIAAILVTHAHRDHSEGAPALAASTGAETYAFGPFGAASRPEFRSLEGLGGGEGADRAFQPDRLLADGEQIDSPDRASGAPAWSLTALHTPGHLGEHLCFALSGPAEGVVFTGDHVMGWSTSMISPPDGDMAAFMSSLRKLAARGEGRGDRLFLPGHGAAITDPPARLAELIAHREAREAAIEVALADGPLSASGLVGRVYSDLDPRLNRAATRTALAHLIALEDIGRARALGPLSVDTVFERR